MVQSVQFPDCCGIIVINGFRGGHPGATADSCISVSDLDVYLKKQEQEYFNKRAGLMAILSQPQQDRIGHVFLERKWEMMKSVNNPRTGQRIYMYYRDLNFTEARKRRIFGADR